MREGHLRDKEPWESWRRQTEPREDKEPDSMALPKPSSPGDAEMNNLAMQG